MQSLAISKWDINSNEVMKVFLSSAQVQNAKQSVHYKWIK